MKEGRGGSEVGWEGGGRGMTGGRYRAGYFLGARPAALAHKISY